MVTTGSRVKGWENRLHLLMFRAALTLQRDVDVGTEVTVATFDHHLQ